jgi:Alcohol dehydrogenase GroES-like domain
LSGIVIPPWPSGWSDSENAGAPTFSRAPAFKDCGVHLPNDYSERRNASGVDQPEVLVRKGVYAWMPPLPAIPGIELAGTIVEQGSGTTQLVLQRRVCKPSVPHERLANSERGWAQRVDFRSA